MIMICDSISLTGFTFTGSNTNSSVKVVEESRERKHRKYNEYSKASQKGE